MSEHSSLPKWVDLVDACRIATRDYAAGLHVLVYGCPPDEQPRPPIARAHVAELVGRLAREGRVRVGIQPPGTIGPGGLAPTIVPPTDPAFRLITWSYGNEIDGGIRNSANSPVGVMPAACGRQILVNLHDLVTVLGIATPASSPEEAIPVEGLSFLDDGTGVLDFPAALRMLEGFRDVWDWISSPARNPNLDGWSLPKTPAAIMEALFAPGWGWPFRIYHRDGETWMRTPYEAQLIFCDEAGAPVGMMLSGSGKAHRIGLDARGYMGELNRLRSEVAELAERRRAEQRAAQEERMRLAEQQAAKAAEVDRADEARKAAAQAREAAEQQRRNALARTVAETMKAGTPSQAAAARAPKARG
jgi:hypothetical protein